MYPVAKPRSEWHVPVLEFRVPSDPRGLAASIGDRGSALAALQLGMTP